MKRLPKELVRPLQRGGKIDSGLLPGINHSDDGGPRGTISGLQEVQECCLKLSTALQQGMEKSQSTIQVLQEALNANTSEVAALKLEANHRSGELEEIKTEKERVTAELNQIKAENSESTSRMAGIMKIVEGFFVHRRDG
jgi:regulator of replication initiation timing